MLDVRACILYSSFLLVTLNGKWPLSLLITRNDNAQQSNFQLTRIVPSTVYMSGSVPCTSSTESRLSSHLAMPYSNNEKHNAH